MNSFIQETINYIQSLPLVVKIIVPAIILLLLCIVFRRKPEKGKTQVTQWHDSNYQNSILDLLPNDVKFDYSHLYQSISEIYNIANRYQNCLNEQKIEVANSIQRKINESQRQIEQKWRQIQGNKDFSRYIGLHYASFTLADSIKKEQEILRNAFVSAKTESNRLSSEIKALNDAIPNSHGQRRRELMQQHQKLCAQHKRICQMKNVFGERNSQYLNQVREQNRITMRYREYIIRNFGQRGRAWGQRLKKRKLDQIS